MLVALMGHSSSSINAGHAALKEAAVRVRILVENSLDFSTSSGRTKLEVDIQLVVTGVGSEDVQSGPKKCIHSLLINIFGINLNEISISG